MTARQSALARMVTEQRHAIVEVVNAELPTVGRSCVVRLAQRFEPLPWGGGLRTTAILVTRVPDGFLYAEYGLGLTRKGWTYPKPRPVPLDRRSA